MNRTQQRHLDRAAQVALASTEKQAHGCVIALGPKVLSVGVNSARNRPAVCSDPARQAGIHAEVAALKALRFDGNYARLTLYSARLLRSGVPALAKPCPVCAQVLDVLGITDIYWTD